MIIGKNWFSGSDESSLSHFTAVKEEGTSAADFRFRINNSGFLDDQGIVPKVEVSLPSIAFSAEHGYFYIASKEMFLFSNKQTEIQDPTYTTDVPNYVQIALGSRPDLEGSGVYTVFEMSGIPHFMTPLVLNPFLREHTSVIVKYTKLLNEVDRSELDFLTGKITALDEPIAEIFETDRIRQLNGSKHSVIDPSRYVYDNITGKIYVKGSVPSIAIEYEDSNTRQTTFGRDFAVSLVGKQKGLFSLALGQNPINPLRTHRKDISVDGTDIYIGQTKESKVLVTVGSIYRLKNGTKVVYNTIDNNRAFALISTDLIEEELYLSGIRVGITDLYGFAYVPIVGYGNFNLHGTLEMKGNSRLTIKPRNLLPINGEIAISVQSAETLAEIQNIELVVLPTIAEIGVAALEKQIHYVEPGAAITELSNVFDFADIAFVALHATHNKKRAQGGIISFGIAEDESIHVLLDAVAVAGFIEYTAVARSLIQTDGTGIYGIH